MINLDELPYIEAANWTRNGPDNKPLSVSKRLIVVHCMEAAETHGTAESVAAWFAGKRGEAPKTSAHYCVDDNGIVCCVPSDRVAWHAPGANSDGIGVELAGYARQTHDEWLDPYSRAMLMQAARLLAALSLKHDIPLTFVGEPNVLAGHHGVTTHAIISHAYKKSTHTDPGPGFPMDMLIAWARVEKS